MSWSAAHVSIHYKDVMIPSIQFDRCLSNGKIGISKYMRCHRNLASQELFQFSSLHKLDTNEKGISNVDIDIHTNIFGY